MRSAFSLGFDAMKIEIYDDAQAVALEAARHIAELSREAVRVRGRFLIATSGGSTPWKMLGELMSLDVPWGSFYLFQVDERVAPHGHADRNLTQLGETLGGNSPLPPDNILSMPVDANDLERGAAEYSARLGRLAGSPPVLDLVHLGMGADGHTASLVPGDTVLDVADREVAVTALYQGRRRMTLTFPCLNRARRVLWLMTGESKADMLVRLRAGDPSIPAGRVNAANAIVFADRPAAQRLEP